MDISRSPSTFSEIAFSNNLKHDEPNEHNQKIEHIHRDKFVDAIYQPKLFSANSSLPESRHTCGVNRRLDYGKSLLCGRDDLRDQKE